MGCNLDVKQERARSGKEGTALEQNVGLTWPHHGRRQSHSSGHKGRSSARSRGGSPLTAEGAAVRRALLTGGAPGWRVRNIGGKHVGPQFLERIHGEDETLLWPLDAPKVT